MSGFMLSTVPVVGDVIDAVAVWIENIYADMATRIGKERFDTLMRLLRDVEQDLTMPLADPVGAAAKA